MLVSTSYNINLTFLTAIREGLHRGYTVHVSELDHRSTNLREAYILTGQAAPLRRGNHNLVSELLRTRPKKTLSGLNLPR